MFIGIDFSISSPGMCYGKSIHDLKFFVVTKRKTLESTENVTFIKHPDITSDSKLDRIERFSRIVKCLIDEIPEGRHDVVLEGFSMGSKGLIFNIAACTGILEYLLHQEGHSITTVAPLSLKKFATGNGRSDKTDMDKAFNSFFMRNSLNPPLLIPNLKSGISPSADLVDAFFLWKYGMDKIR